MQRRVSGSTPVQFTRDEPLELKGVPGLTRSKNFVGYISFALFATHVEGDAKRSKAVCCHTITRVIRVLISQE